MATGGHKGAPGPDLLSWPDVKPLMDAAEAAEADRLSALKAVRLAPPGEITVRRRRLEAATTRALAAELAAARALRGRS